MPPEDDNREQRKALTSALPYLRDSGWIASRLARSSVDAAGQPIPWYRYSAIDFLRDRVTSGHRVFEFGSGNSTLWWARHAQQVTAVEHDPTWASKVRAQLPINVALHEVPLDADGDYCRALLRTGERFDIVVIDGRDRVNCAINCLSGLTESGVIVWDDSHRRRYRPGIDLLRERGFRRLRFTGLGPIAANSGETSVFYRGRNCLGV